MPETLSANSHIFQEQIDQILQEIDQIPPEFLPKLLQTIRLFRETVITEIPKAKELTEIDLNGGQTLSLHEIGKLPKEERIKRNQGAIDLINSWIEDGDEQEQTETWKHLREAMDQDRLSNRKLFL